MSIEQKLFAAAAELAERRYPAGWGGAAAIRAASGNILISIAPDAISTAGLNAP